MMKRTILCVLALLPLVAYAGGKITMSNPDEQELLALLQIQTA